MRSFYASSLIAILLGGCGISGQAKAADLCKALALRDVAALHNPTSILPKGDFDTAITQYRVNRNTKVTCFCSHGGYCYPTHVFVNGQRVQALKMTNCSIGAAQPSNIPGVVDDEIIYEVIVNRQQNSPQALRRDDVDNRLREMGLCSACASNVAAFYVNKPKSQCGQLARQALEGNPAAIQALQSDPSYCHYWR